MKQLFKNIKDIAREISWLVGLAVLCVVLLNVIMFAGWATLATAVSLSTTAIVAAILSLRE